MSSPVVPSQFKAVIPDPSNGLCSNFKKALLQFPVLVWKFVNWLLDEDGNLTTAVQQSVSDLTVRPGDLIFSAAPLDTEGRLLCNGQTVSRATYPRLFAAIGTLYGEGDASSTFGVPDYRARFPVGVGTFESGALAALGTAGGTERVTLDDANFPHTHAFGRMEANTGGDGDDAFLLSGGTTTATSGAARGVTGAGSGIQSTNIASGAGDFLVTAAQELGDTVDPISKLNPFLPCFIYVKT